MAVPTLYLFDRWDERVGVLPTLGSVTHAEELGGEDTLELACTRAPGKGDRIVWRDPESSAWREHEVVRTDEAEGGACRVYAESSLCELLRDYVVEEQLVGRTAAQAMAAVLARTRWSLGEVGVGDARRGARFSYGVNLAGCTRTVLEDEVVTALYGWGKGLPIEDEQGNATGGYTRRLSFESVNGSAKWVGDDDARLRWGRWDAARGERVHAFGDVVFPECEDPSELLALTRAALAERCHPRVSYECDVAMLDGGVAVGLGDDVAVVDRSRAPEWRLTARCVRRVRTFGPGRVRTHVTLGSVERATWEASAEIVRRVSAVEETASKASDAVSSFEDLSGKEY